MQHIDKPWGSEDIIETNVDYTLKKLFMKKGHCCSLQYHEFKHETIYVVEGTLEVVSGDSQKKAALTSQLLKAGESVVIPPRMVHRMCGHTDVTYMEASTSQLNDVIRLEDDYGRAGT